MSRLNAHDKLNLIKTRLEQAFAPSYLQVLDESDDHRGHAGHKGGGRHFAIQIQADCFKAKSRVAAHREIYALFTDLMPGEIHALRIEIVVKNIL